MIFLLCTTWLFASSAALEKPYYDLEKAEQYFEKFINTFNRTYQNNAEKQRRLEIFKITLKEINQLNAESEAAHGVNNFSDLTSEEFVNQHTGFIPGNGLGSVCQVLTDYDINTNEAPPSLDYRQLNAVTTIKNQIPCNSCWAFSTIGSIEGQFAIRHQQLVQFSEQQLMDCLRCSGHCERGSYMTRALSELTQLPGVEYETDYPYVGRDLRCQATPGKAQVKITGCINYQLTDENKLKEALFKHGPIAVAVNGAAMQHYTGGIYEARKCPPSPLSHGVLLVGYGTERGRDYWLVKNSYGFSFGEEGYVRLARGTNTCGLMNNDAASALVA